MAFKDRLKKLREEVKEISQRELAKILNVPATTYANWENGKEPNYETLIRLADYFDITVDELIGRTNPTPEEQVERDFRLVESWLNRAGFEIDNYSPDTEAVEGKYIGLLYIYPKGWQSMADGHEKVFIIPKYYFVKFGMAFIADCEKIKEQAIIMQMQAFGAGESMRAVKRRKPTDQPTAE